MKFILFCAIVLALGYGLFAFVGFTDGGYVKIFLGDYLVEVTFVVFVIGLVATVIALYFLIRTIVGLFRAPKRVGDWNTQRNQGASQQKLGDGFLSLMQGDWKRAEKQLVAKTDSRYNKVPYVNFLAAAQAAQEQGKYAQRDHYLSQAMQQAPKNRLAVGMTKARLHQQAGQHEDALSTLLGIEKEGARNQQYMAMLVQAYDHHDDFEALQTVLPKARRLGALPEDVLEDIQADIDLDKFAAAKDKELVWKSLSKTSQRDAKFVKIFAEHQLLNDRADVAEKLIRTTLKTGWDESLVNTYGRIQTTRRKKLLRQIDGWLLARPESAELHLAQGRLLVQDNQPDSAEKSFEQAIHLSDLPEAYEELGGLYEKNQDLRKALSLYRVGLSNSNVAKIKSLPGLSDVEVSSTDSNLGGHSAADQVAETTDAAGVETAVEGELVDDAQSVTVSSEQTNKPA